MGGATGQGQLGQAANPQQSDPMQNLNRGGMPNVAQPRLMDTYSGSVADAPSWIRGGIEANRRQVNTPSQALQNMGFANNRMLGGSQQAQGKVGKIAAPGTDGLPGSGNSYGMANAGLGNPIRQDRHGSNMIASQGQPVQLGNNAGRASAGAPEFGRFWNPNDWNAANPMSNFESPEARQAARQGARQDARQNWRDAGGLSMRPENMNIGRQEPRAGAPPTPGGSTGAGK